MYIPSNHMNQNKNWFQTYGVRIKLNNASLTILDQFSKHRKPSQAIRMHILISAGDMEKNEKKAKKIPEN